MHDSSLLRMRWFLTKFALEFLKSRPTPCPVLDVGSFDVNGSYKQLFQSKLFAYQGLDMEHGPNVDIVPGSPYDWRDVIADASFDIVISGQAFEHIEFFWLTFSEMVRVLKPGGLLCLLAPRLEAIHRYPVDCYRFDTDGFLALAKYGNLLPLHASTDMAPPNAGQEWFSTSGDAFLVAQKPEDWTGMLDVANYRFTHNDLASLSHGFVPRPPEISKDALIQDLWSMLKTANENLGKASAIIAKLSDKREADNQ